MAPWVWVLIVAGLLLLVGGGHYAARFLGRRHRTRHHHFRRMPGPVGASVPAGADALAIPMPGPPQESSLANSAVYQGQVYFFLSVRDRDTFEANPDPSINTFVRGTEQHDEVNAVRSHSSGSLRKNYISTQECR